MCLARSCVRSQRFDARARGLLASRAQTTCRSEITSFSKRTLHVRVALPLAVVLLFAYSLASCCAPELEWPNTLVMSVKTENNALIHSISPLT